MDSDSESSIKRKMASTASMVERLRSGVKTLRKKKSNSKRSSNLGNNSNAIRRIGSSKESNTLQILQKSLEELIAYLSISSNAPQTEGILRISPYSPDVSLLKTRILNGEQINYSESDIHCVATTLRSILRGLPEPICTFALYSDFIQSLDLTEKISRVNKLSDVVSHLPAANRDLLSQLMNLAVKIQANETKTKMNAQAISIVLAPSGNDIQVLLKDSSNVICVVKDLIENYSAIFHEKQLPIAPPKDAQPNTPKATKATEEVDSSKQLKDKYVELLQKESELHSQLLQAISEKSVIQTLLETKLHTAEEQLQQSEEIIAQQNQEIINLKKQLQDINPTDSNGNSTATKNKNNNQLADKKSPGKSKRSGFFCRFTTVLVVLMLAMFAFMIIVGPNRVALHSHMSLVNDWYQRLPIELQDYNPLGNKPLE